MHQGGYFLQVVDEGAHLFLSGIIIGRAQNGRWMHGGSNVGSERQTYQLAPLAIDAKVLTKKGLGRGCAEANQNLRLHKAKFSFDPRMTGVDFRITRLFVNTALAALGRLPFEMFDNIRYIDLIAIDSRFLQSAIQQLAGRAHEWTAGEILLISGLLANQH